MTSRERVWAAITHQPVDRVPAEFWGTTEVRQMLLEHFDTEDWQVVLEGLGVDGIARAPLPYTGPPWTGPDGGPAGLWGVQSRTIELPTGGVYHERIHAPMAEFTEVAQVEDFDLGDPADWDFEAAADFCRRHHAEKVIMAGYIAPYVDLWNLFGEERALLNIALRPELIEAVLDRTMAYRLAQHRMLFEACGEHLDLTQVTDDFGAQSGLVMSREHIRRIFWPHYRRAIALAHEFGLKVYHHDDGGIGEIIPDLVEMGVEVLNPIQWRCRNMDLQWLKREFGDALCFDGAVDNQEVLPFGTPEDVRREVRKNIRILASDGTGYICGPCHNIQSGTPLENVLALYDEIRVSGSFE
ncbi:MAG: uroporphyrinogen decarboxylase family protein [Armatimonadota bacterium]|nr:uroporphyrinogen decarboxylase family protein [Armatimonadota bacterium]